MTSKSTNANSRPSPPIVRYSAIPGLGRVKWAFYADALQSFVRELDSMGEFSRLSKMNQLGALARGLDSTLEFSARHTRFDYLSLCLYLIELMEGRGGQTRLQSKIEVGGSQLSKGELVKTWLLLNAFGHLHDSYLAERFVLQKMRTNSALRSVVEEQLPPFAKETLGSVLDNGQWWSLSSYLALYRLAVTSFPDSIRKFGTEAIELLHGDPSKPSFGKLDEARSVYRVTREIAYLYLDLQFTARSIFLDPVALALQIHEEIGLVTALLDRFDPRGAVLESIGKYLCEQVYLNPASTKYLYTGLSHLERWSKNRDFSDCLDKLIQTRQLPDAESCKCEYAYSLPYPPEVWNDLEAYENLRKRVGKRYRIYTARWQTPQRYAEAYLHSPESYAATLSAPKIFSALQVCRSIWKEASRETELWKILAQRGQKDFVPMSRILRSLPAYVIRTWLGEDIQLQSKLVETYRFITLPWLWCYGITEASRAIKDFEQRLAEEGIEPVYKEAQAFGDAFESTKRSKGYYLICQGPLYLRKGDIEQEFDAVWIRVGSAEITLFLLEAKHGNRSSGQKALNELREKLKRICAPNPAPNTTEVFRNRDVGVLSATLS